MDIFFLLGQIPDGTWHQRIIKAKDRATVEKWWHELWGNSTHLILNQHDFEQVLKVVVSLTEHPLAPFGVYAVCHALPAFESPSSVSFGLSAHASEPPTHPPSCQTGQLHLTPVLAQSRHQAKVDYERDHPEDQVMCVVDSAPLLDVLARLREVSQGGEPDEFLAGLEKIA